VTVRTLNVVLTAVIMMYLVGCDMSPNHVLDDMNHLPNDPERAHLTDKYTQSTPVVFPRGNSCNLGIYTAFFESFDYKWIRDARDPRIDQDGYLFGRNTWKYCNGGTVASKYARAWFRYNESHANNYDPGTNLYIDGAGTRWAKLVMTLESGYRGGWHPMIRSRFLSNEGVYVARISFDRLQKRSSGKVPALPNDPRRIYQAFWIDQPTDVHPDPSVRRPEKVGATKELDFEWTNVFSFRNGANGRWIDYYHDGALTANVHTTNSDGEMPNQVGPLLMSCTYYTHQPVYSLSSEGCFVNGNREKSYIIGDGSPPRPASSPAHDASPVGTEFWYLIIKYSNSDGVQFYGVNPGYRGVTGTFWLGQYTGNYAWGTPVHVVRSVIPNLQESVPMNIMLSIHASGVSSVLDKDHQMIIDWVYFSDDWSLLNQSPEGIYYSVRSEVESFMNNGHYRVNTAGLKGW